MKSQELFTNNMGMHSQWLVDDVTPDIRACGPDLRPFYVLIVDDDPDVHSATRLALREVQFKNRALEFISAFSGGEAFQVLQNNRNIALVLLDVVMEADDAGLQLVERIRGELNNQLVRIVLRTGQPGVAPEKKVIVDYDINDYKAKTELTTQKLYTTVIASLRAYENLLTIELGRVGLGKIIVGAGNLYQSRSLREFALRVLNEMSEILDARADGVFCQQGMAHVPRDAGPEVIAATGTFASLADSAMLQGDHSLSLTINNAFRAKQSQRTPPVEVMYIRTTHGHEFAIAITPSTALEQFQHDLLQVFCHRIGAAFDNMFLFGQLRKAQEATVIALADLAEFRDEDTGDHVQRVQILTDRIAAELHERHTYPDQTTPAFLEMVGMASTLHDVGKVATPDHILLKCSNHTPEEREVMRQHAQVGETILNRAAKMVEGTSYLTLGAQIAGGHHEHFDGNGYPRGLKGQDIPLAARIVAVVDVFDALLHRRPYKEPWPLDTALQYISERRAIQFDPAVVDALVAVVGREPQKWEAKELH